MFRDKVLRKLMSKIMKKKMKVLIARLCVQLFATPWTVAHQAPLSREFFRQEYWSGLPFPSGDLLDPRINLGSLALQADSLASEPPGKITKLNLKRIKAQHQSLLPSCIKNSKKLKHPNSLPYFL